MPIRFPEVLRQGHTVELECLKGILGTRYGVSRDSLSTDGTDLVLVRIGTLSIDGTILYGIPNNKYNWAHGWKAKRKLNYVSHIVPFETRGIVSVRLLDDGSASDRIFLQESHAKLSA